MQLQKVISMQKRPSCEKSVQPQKAKDVKSKVAAKKMAVMIVQGKNFKNNNSCLSLVPSLSKTWRTHRFKLS